MFATLHLLAAESSDSGAAGGALIVGSAIIAWAIGSALVFQKAGAPAWAGIVPGWHLKYLGRMTGKNPWSLLFSRSTTRPCSSSRRVSERVGTSVSAC